MKKTHNLTKTKNSKLSTKKGDLLEDLRKMIDQAKQSLIPIL